MRKRATKSLTHVVDGRSCPHGGNEDFRHLDLIARLIGETRIGGERHAQGQSSCSSPHVAKAIADHIKRYPNKSLGVACLSAQQRDGVEGSGDCHSERPTSHACH
jgi:hypothetical protein